MANAATKELNMKTTIIKSLQELKEKGRRIIFFRWVSATSEGSIKYLNVDSASADEIHTKADEIVETLQANNANTLYISSYRKDHCYTRTIRLA
jgi:hypothetical protein